MYRNGARNVVENLHNKPKTRFNFCLIKNKNQQIMDTVVSDKKTSE